MRKLAILALASTAIATPALARDDSWYIGVDAGGMIVEDSALAINDATTGAAIGTAQVDNAKGYDVGGEIGYDFGGFRLESEVAYKRANINNYTSTTTTPAIDQATRLVRQFPAGSFSYAGGKTTALSFMLNGLLDFGADDGLQGFVGGGVGVARVKEAYALNTLGTNFLDDSNTGFAWQALAGIRAPLSAHWDVGVKYRFFNAPNVNLIDYNGRAVDTRFRSHSLLGTLTYNFGGAPVPPPVVAPPPAVEPPPPPPAPLPPPPPVVCNNGPYIVFFDWDKSDITADAAGILDGAVAQYANCGNAHVMLAGHADKSGTPKYNQGLSERRNTSVRGYLGNHGIADGVISTQAFGESAPRVDTADGVRELQNRRVEITYGPGSGM